MKRLLYFLLILMVLNPLTIRAMETGASEHVAQDLHGKEDVKADNNQAKTSSRKKSKKKKKKTKKVLNATQEKDIHGKEEVSDVPENKKPIINIIQLAESSLYKQTIKKVAQEGKNIGEAFANILVQALPAQQVMDVLNECIFTDALLTWSFKKKEELLEKISKFESMKDYQNELQELIWTMQECQKLDSIDPSIIEELKNITQYSVTFPIPAQIAASMPGGQVGSHIVTVNLLNHPVSRDIQQLHVVEQVIDDQGLEYVDQVVSILDLKTTINTFEDIDVALPQEHVMAMAGNAEQAVMYSLYRFALGKMLEQFKPPYSLTGLIKEILRLCDKDAAYIVACLLADSKLNTIQKNYMESFFIRYISLNNTKEEIQEYKDYIDEVKEYFKPTEKQCGFFMYPKAYEFSRILKEDDVASYKVLIGVEPVFINAYFIRTHCPRINAFLLARGVNLNPSDAEKVASPLFTAVIAGDHPLTTELLAQGANQNKVVYFDEGSMVHPDKQYPLPANVLALAIVGNHEETVHALIKAGADVNAHCPITGKTMLEHAYENGNEHIIALLKIHGADERPYQVKKALLKQLPTTKQLEDYKDYFEDLSCWTLAEKIEVVRQMYFDKATWNMSTKTKKKIAFLKKLQARKQELAKKQLRQYLLGYKERKPITTVINEDLKIINN